MAKNYDSLFPKELVFGKFLEGKENFDTVEIGNTEEADTDFKMTVNQLDQKFCLVPQNLKEAYLIEVLKTTKLKKNQQCIVFTSTCRNCHFLALLLTELGFDVTLLHS